MRGYHLKDLTYSQLRKLEEKVINKRKKVKPLSMYWLRLGWIEDQCMLEFQKRHVLGYGKD